MWAISRKNLWDRTPVGAKRRLRRVLGVVPPAWLLGRRFRQQLALVDQAQWWPAERARAYQVECLRRICVRAVERSSFYRRHFQQAGFDPRSLRSVEDLAALPLIDKETVREHREAMCTVSPRSASVDYVSTGGSSGTPLGFHIGADRSATEYAFLVASWRRVGYRLDMPQAVFRGKVVSRNGAGLRHEFDPVLRRHYYSSFHMIDEEMARDLQHVATIGPCYLHVYPSSVSTLTRFIERTRAPVPDNIRGILAGSEMVYAEDRAAAERTFGVRYFSWYGHSEKLVLGAECEHRDDIHIWPTYGYMELIDETGRPVTTPGQRGEIVGTGFINSVMPFIRYRTGDHATFVGRRCAACGRDHLLLRDIRGHRTQEMLVAADGSEISWTAVNMHDRTFDHVRQLQFRQERPGEATLRIVPAPSFDETDAEQIRQNLARKLAGRISFVIELCDEIPLTPRGKQTFVDQRIDRTEIRAEVLRR